MTDTARPIQRSAVDELKIAQSLKNLWDLLDDAGDEGSKIGGVDTE